MVQLFNVLHCSHPVKKKKHLDKLVIRTPWGKPNHNTEHMPVFPLKLWLFNFLLECYLQKQKKRHTVGVGGCGILNLWNNGRVLLAVGTSVFVEWFSQCCLPLTGIFMVKPVTKGNLSQNTDPSGTVKIKHGGLEERCHSSVKSYVKKEHTHTHAHTHRHTQYVR